MFRLALFCEGVYVETRLFSSRELARAFADGVLCGVEHYGGGTVGTYLFPGDEHYGGGTVGTYLFPGDEIDVEAEELDEEIERMRADWKKHGVKLNTKCPCGEPAMALDGYCSDICRLAGDT